MELLLAAFGLGLAGIDILGVLIVTSALSAGVSKRSIAGFAATVFIGTVLLAPSFRYFSVQALVE